ncbi:MAG: hypothetical protein HC804_05570, partial [Anaerolineae bacterium]|nr:hypothetical protein [Anaerolineae bacterium]
MTTINQFSGILVYLVVGVGLLAVVLWRMAAQKRRVGLLVGTAVLLFGGLLIFQPQMDGATAVTVQQTIAAANGRPVFLELYSD